MPWFSGSSLFNQAEVPDVFFCPEVALFLSGQNPLATLALLRLAPPDLFGLAFFLPVVHRLAMPLHVIAVNEAPTLAWDVLLRILLPSVVGLHLPRVRDSLPVLAQVLAEYGGAALTQHSDISGVVRRCEAQQC